MGAKPTKTSPFSYRAEAQPRRNQPRLNRDLDSNHSNYHNYFVKVVIVGDETDRTKLLNKISCLSKSDDQVNNICPILDFAIAYLALPQPEFSPFNDPNSNAIYKFHLWSYGNSAVAGQWNPAIFVSATIVLAVTKPETKQQLFQQLLARNDISATTIFFVTNQVGGEVKTVAEASAGTEAGAEASAEADVANFSSSYSFDFNDSEKVKWMLQDAVETTWKSGLVQKM